MDILVTFEDGTTELRPERCPVLYDRRRCDGALPELSEVTELRPWWDSGGEAWLLVTAKDELTYRCAKAGVAQTWRGTDVYAWRLTGHTEDPYTLTGEWQPCRVETLDEQIARLTRERDEARECARRLERRITAIEAMRADALRGAAAHHAAGMPTMARNPETRASVLQDVLKVLRGES